ncbi:hypothetical protein [Streptomyces microflavus]|uniref:hypothetical protein n=1 Tax=Streptomyces microflavus TaxID=1919 RepID=UPI003674BBFB
MSCPLHEAAALITESVGLQTYYAARALDSLGRIRRKPFRLEKALPVDTTIPDDSMVVLVGAAGSGPRPPPLGTATTSPW